MGEHSNPVRIFMPSEEDSPRNVQRSLSETDAIKDLQTLDDRTDLFGGDACLEEESHKGKDLTSSENKNFDHNFDSRHWDVHNVHALRDRIQISSNSSRSDFIAVMEEDLEMQHGNFLYPTKQVCSGPMVDSDNMWPRHHKVCDPGEKVATSQTVVHTTPLTKSKFATQPVEFARKGIDTMSCPNLQNDDYDVDDESIKTALSELKQSVNEISRSFCSKARSPNDETMIWKEVYDDNSQFRRPSPLSAISNQSSGLPWSMSNTKTFLMKEIGEVKSSVKKLGKEIRSSLSPVAYSHSGLSTRKALIDTTDGLYSGDVTLSHGFESPTTFQIPESADYSNAAKDTNKDAHDIDKENLRRCVSSIVVNKQERPKTLADNVQKSYETSLNYPNFPSQAKTDDQMTSESSDRFAINMRDQANGVFESGLDETRPLENAGDFSGSTASPDSSVKSSDVQEDLLNRMLQVLQNLQDIFTSEHHPLCKGVRPRALEIVNVLKGVMRQEIIPSTFGENQNVSYQEQNKAVHSLSTCMSTTSSSFLDKVKHTDLMNHTSTIIDRSGSGRVTPCQQTWPPRTNCPECPIELRPRETLNGRIKRVICELYCEIQPLEDGIKAKALAMLEEIHGIVESLQVCEQSEDFISSNETPNFDTQQDSAPNLKASSCEASGHFSHDKCNDCVVENERYNGSNRSRRQNTTDRDSPCSPMTQTTTSSLSIENIRGRIKSLIHKHSDLTLEETNQKILSVLSDMEKVLDTIGDQNPPENGEVTQVNKTDEPQQSQFPVSSKMSCLIGNLQDAILDMRPNLQIADYDPQTKICFLLNILADELQLERTELSTLKNVEGPLKSLECELCQNGAGNSTLAFCIREMIQVVKLVVAEPVSEEKSKCKSKARRSDAICRKGRERCDNACKTDTVKAAACDKTHKKGNCMCKSEPKVIEELFIDSGEDCETIPCETVKLATATCDTLQAEEKHVCKPEASCVRNREASTERLQSCHDTAEENRENRSPCPGNEKGMDSLVVIGEHCTAPNRCYSEVIFNPTEPITASIEAADSPLTQILAKLRDLVKSLEMEDSTLQQCTILKIIETFNHIETTLDLDPQYATILKEVRKALCQENEEKREPPPCQTRESSCSRWRRISRRHRNRSNNFTFQ